MGHVEEENAEGSEKACEGRKGAEGTAKMGREKESGGGGVQIEKCEVDEKAFWVSWVEGGYGGRTSKEKKSLDWTSSIFFISLTIRSTSCSCPSK